MDFQTYLDAAVKTSRIKSLAHSPQLSLGRLIDELEAIEDKSLEVSFDFEYAYPTTLDSWRGAYDELALGFGFEGYGYRELSKDIVAPTVETLLNELIKADGRVFEGWKGGQFKMSRDTPIWVANPGNSSDTGVVGVLNPGWRVVIITGYCRY